jgi:threonine/homoserine/homoserine lactone efflux protein
MRSLRGNDDGAAHRLAEVLGSAHPSRHMGIAAFSLLALVLVLTPGAGTAFLTDVVIQRGRRAGQLGAIGIWLGALTHAVAATAGLSLLLRESPRAARVVAIVGGAYIAFLGLRSFVRLARGLASPTHASHAEQPRAALVREGLVTNLLNAPVALFYLVIVPQYVPAIMRPLEGMALLAAIHLAMVLAWTMTYTTLLGSLVQHVTRPAVRAGMQLVTASILVALGVRSMIGA